MRRFFLLAEKPQDHAARLLGVAAVRLAAVGRRDHVDRVRPAVDGVASGIDDPDEQAAPPGGQRARPDRLPRQVGARLDDPERARAAAVGRLLAGLVGDADVVVLRVSTAGLL